MTITSSPSHIAWKGLLVCAGLFGTPWTAQAHHVGDALTTDQQLVASSDQFLAALAQWQKLAPALQTSGLDGLVQLAQTRQQRMIALVQADPIVAASRMMPRSLRARMPAQAAAFVETEVRVQGTGFINVADNFAAGISHATFKLLGAGGGTPQSVYLADPTGQERDLHKLAGKKLNFPAMRVGDLLVLLDKRQVQATSVEAAGRTAATSTGTLQAAGSVVQGDQKTLSILVNFSDKPVACTAADVGNRVFGNTGSTVNNLFKDSSRGLVSFSGTAIGPFNINFTSTGTCDYTAWGVAAEAAAKAAGFDPALYTRVNYVTPPNSTCGWSGLAYLPGRQSWIQSCSSTGVYAHELGHNLTLHHAATPTAEYGDASDPMGGARTVGSNAANRVMAGWQPAGTVQDVGIGGSFSVTSVTDSTVTSTPQVLRLAKLDTAEQYYVSVRTATGYDTALGMPFVDAVSVHRATGTLPTRTYLMQVLAAGQSFTDVTNGITLTNQGVSNGVGVVGVTLAGAVCARAAPAVAVVPASQSGAPGAALNYSVTVSNRNTAACGSSIFNLSQTVPTGISGTLSAPSLAIAAGASGSVNWTATSDAAAPAATYTLDATAADAGQPTSVSTAHASYVVFRDSLPPALTITSPTATSYTNVRSISIAATASDVSGIQAVEFSVDGALIVRDTSAPYTANWNTRRAAKGLHTIKARAIDNSGLATEKSVTVTLN